MKAGYSDDLGSGRRHRSAWRIAVAMGGERLGAVSGGVTMSKVDGEGDA